VFKPSLGRIVLAYCDPAYNNGLPTCPAVITRVWSEDLVNLRLIPDSDAPMYSRTSVKLMADEETAREYVAGLSGFNVAPAVAYWPPRV
jgi:hypothetical protein